MGAYRNGIKGKETAGADPGFSDGGSHAQSARKIFDRVYAAAEQDWHSSAECQKC